jgi:hypothetical protein
MELFSIRRAMAFPPVTGLQAFIPEDSDPDIASALVTTV